jgi:hypothetical protein
MTYYVINKETKEYQYYGYDEGYPEEYISDYYYLVGVKSKSEATEFNDRYSASMAIVYSEGSVEDYDIAKGDSE